jgi:hypothetical protein
MMKKLLIGMLAVFMLVAIASLGYRFGQYLAKKDAPCAPATQESPA